MSLRWQYGVEMCRSFYVSWRTIYVVYCFMYLKCVPVSCMYVCVYVYMLIHRMCCQNFSYWFVCSARCYKYATLNVGRTEIHKKERQEFIEVHKD
jgi:hypothetical protein